MIPQLWNLASKIEMLKTPFWLRQEWFHPHTLYFEAQDNVKYDITAVGLFQISLFSNIVEIPPESVCTSQISQEHTS